MVAAGLRGRKAVMYTTVLHGNGALRPQHVLMSATCLLAGITLKRACPSFAYGRRPRHGTSLKVAWASSHTSVETREGVRHE